MTDGYAHEVSSRCYGFSCCEQLMLSRFFTQGFRANSAAYIEVIEIVVKLCINNVRADSPYIFKAQDWMGENFRDFRTYGGLTPRALIPSVEGS